ncbi:MAG: type transport system permease protein [Pyrinomonadaceae bacterium]|nr:type transport system permease protein [Pyrinomonadaceae bacterium]
MPDKTRQTRAGAADKQTRAGAERDLNAAQLGALVWLKWRLFVSAMRSKRGAANRAASALGTLFALTLSLLLAAGLGAGAYFVVYNRSGVRASSYAPDIATGASVEALFLLFGMVSMIYLVWATAPLSFGGGNDFDPGRLLLYPVSLRKLFALDLLSELTSLASIFAAPAIFALALGAGLAHGRIGGALVVALCATLFGMSLAKLLSTCLGTLMRMRRTRGEALLAVLGVIGALSGLALGQSDRLCAHFGRFPFALRLTPMGATAAALAGGASGVNSNYLLSLAVLLAYTLAATFATYKIAKRSLEGNGGGGGARAARVEAGGDGNGAAAKAWGWRLPFGSEELSSVFEKELRYAARNAQLRTMAAMPIIMTLSFKLIGSRRGGGFPRGGGGHSGGAGAAASFFAAVAPYAEGTGAALSVLYVFLITSALSANLFGYEAGGMRAYVLAPVARRTILAGKNLAGFTVSLVFTVAVVAVNALLYRDLTPRALLFTSLCFVFFAAAAAVAGNWFSLRFPKRLQFGKRMNASGVAGLLLLPVFLLIAVAPAVAVLGGYAAQSLLVEYAILAAFAVAGVFVYLVSLRRQGQLLAERELDILEAVTGRGDN